MMVKKSQIIIICVFFLFGCGRIFKKKGDGFAPGPSVTSNPQILDDGENTPSTNINTKLEVEPKPTKTEQLIVKSPEQQDVDKTWGTKKDSKSLVISKDQKGIDLLSDFIIDGDDSTTDISDSYSPDLVLTPEGKLSVLGDFSIDNSEVDTFLKIELFGSDAYGNKINYQIRIRRRRVILYFTGENGSVYKHLKTDLASKENYRFEFVVYKDALALYFSHHNYKRWSPNHIIYLTTGLSHKSYATLQFKASIKKGSAHFKDLTISRLYPDSDINSSPLIESDFLEFLDNTKIRTLVTGQRFLGPLTGAVNPNFYHTTFFNYAEDSIEDLMAKEDPKNLANQNKVGPIVGTSYEWSSLGGRKRYNRLECQTVDQAGNPIVKNCLGKVIRWKFTTSESKDLDRLYALFRINGWHRRSVDNKWLYHQHDLILNRKWPAFYARSYLYPRIYDQRNSKYIVPTLKPNTSYNVEILAIADGSAIYFYETSKGRPQRPAHIFLTENWQMWIRFYILRGALKKLERDIDMLFQPDQIKSYLASKNSITEYMNMLLDQSDSEVWKTSCTTFSKQACGVTGEEERWVTYKDEMGRDNAFKDSFVSPTFYKDSSGNVVVSENGIKKVDTIDMKGDGTRYQTYPTRVDERIFYSRDPEKPEYGETRKALKFKVDFKNSKLDPIFHLAIEGRDKYGNYRRHGLVFRNWGVYAQYRVPLPFNWGSQRVTGVDDLPLMDYSLDGEYFVKFEVYPDGSAIYFWKAGTPQPKDPIHVNLNFDFVQYNWRAWIYRNEANLKVYYQENWKEDYQLEQTDTNCPDSATLVCNSTRDTWEVGDAETTAVTMPQVLFGRDFWITTIDGINPYDSQTNTYTLIGNNKNYASRYIDYEPLHRERGFMISLKVQVDKAQDTYSGLLVAIDGAALSDPTGWRYRRHGFFFSRDAIYSQSYGSGVQGYHGATAFDDLQKDTWYNLELVGIKNASLVTVWKEGDEKPKPQSVFYSSDWSPRFRIWIRNGQAKIKDLVYQHSIAPNLTHTKKDDLDYMGDSFNPGILENLIDPDGEYSTILANFDLFNTNLGCWQDVSRKFFDTTSDGFILKGDAVYTWDGFSCTTAMDRRAQQKVIIDFEVPETLTYRNQIVMGVKGVGNFRGYRQHALQLIPSGDGFYARTQTYSRKTGWQYYNPVYNLEVGKEYRCIIEVSLSGSKLTFMKNFGDKESVLFHDYINSDPNSQYHDFDPHLFIRMLKDKLLIKHITIQ